MKEIKDRMDKGYTMSLYGTRELLHEQMLKDISSLLNLFDAREKQLEKKIDELEDYKVDLIKDGFYVTAEDFSSRKQELKSLLESWKH